ncbi:MAG: S-layer homology domain-containing protein [Patescibacteria group bacterium]
MLKNILWAVFGTVIGAAFFLHQGDAQKAPPPVFTDILAARETYRASISFLAQRGVVSGYEDGSFGPKNKVTRAEMVTMLLRVYLGDQVAVPATPSCFKDVKTGWYVRYVCYAKKKNIVSGYPDGRFRPSNNVLFAEALAMGFKAGSLTPPQNNPNDEWYQALVDFAHTNNIFSKYAILPGTEITREQAAYILHQIILMKEGTKQPQNHRVTNSLGCGKDPPQKVPTSSVVNGVARNYITVIPSDYEKNIPKNLIFAFHGRTNSNEMVRRYYGIEKPSRGEAIIVYPSGIKNGSSYTWSSPGDKANNLRDFALFDQLLKEFSTRYCVDMDHIFVVGHSLGAWFTNSLACARGDTIRGIASLGGGTTTGSCTGPVAAMILHNPKDNLVPFHDGEVARDQLKNQNQCNNKTVKVEPSVGNCVQYTCSTDAPLIWCPHNVDIAEYDHSYYPHTWPNFTGTAIWNFFRGLDK